MKKTLLFTMAAVLAPAVIHAEIPKGMTELVLEVHDAGTDADTGFQWLLDSSHSSCGDWYYPWDFAYFGDYAPFDYFVPEGADKAGKIKVVEGEASVYVPAGTYDWMVARTDGTGTYFPLGDYAMTDDFTFVEGKTYRMEIAAADGEPGYGPYARLMVPTDLAMTGITVPTSGTELTASEKVSVRVTNLGTTDASGFTLTYSVNGADPVSEKYAGTVKPGETVDYTFATAADLSAPGRYTFAAAVELEDDMLPHNNSAEASCRHLEAAELPFEVEFCELGEERVDDEWIIINNSTMGCGWFYNDWGFDMSGEPGVMMYQSSSMAQGDDWLITMPLRFSKGRGHVIFSATSGFATEFGEMELCVGTAPDASAMKPVKHYTFDSSDWAYKAVNFDVEADGVLYIGFHGVSSPWAGAFMIGSVQVGQGEFVGTPLITLTRTLLPFSNCDMPSDSRIGIEVANRGTGELAAYTLTATVNGQKFSTDFTDPIQSDEVRAIYLDHAFDFSATGAYEIEFALTGDGTNLVAEAGVECFEPITTLPVVTNFTRDENSDIWQSMRPGAWDYEAFFGDFYATCHGRENGLLSRGIALERSARVSLSFKGSDWDGTELAIFMGPASADPSTYECVFTQPDVSNQEQTVEFVAPVATAGNYSFVIADMGPSFSTSYLKLNEITISEVYPHDLNLSKVAGSLVPFTPTSAVGGEHIFTATVVNRGSEPMNNVKVSVSVAGGKAVESDAVLTIAADESAEISVAVALPELKAGETVDVAFEVKADEADENPADNSCDFPTITATDYTYAYENLDEPENGTGSDMGGVALGNVFTLATAADLTGMTVGFAPIPEFDTETADSNVRFSIYAINTDMSVGRCLYSDTRKRGTGGFADIDVPAMRLAAGSYLFEVEQVSSFNMGLAYDPERASSLWQRNYDEIEEIDGYALCIRAQFKPGAKTYAADVAVLEFTAPANVEALFNDNTTVAVKVRNMGYEQAEFAVELDVDGLTSGNQKLALMPYEESEVVFTGIDLSATGNHTLTANAVFSADENPGNNSLTMTAVTVEAADPYVMDFENCSDFAAAGDPWNPAWTTVDRNGVDTDFYWAYDHPHRGEPCGFMAFNADATVPAMSETGFDQMTPHSGQRFGLAFNFDSYAWGAENLTESDVWIISPKLRLGTDSEFELYVRSVLTGYMAKEEPYRVLVSTTDNEPESFNIVGDNERTASGDGWEQVVVDLSDYDGQDVHVAVQYLGRPLVNTCLLIDDLAIRTNLPTGIADVAETETTVRVNGRDVIAPEGSRIYTLEGIETGFFNLANGVYIVRTPAKSVKVVIR
ncbi:MAG: DUF2436 domain-containing protein [Bacteroidales bacterium]|nr:DUF2436 domain-containing protein [Bacteroidales bacterium]